MSDPRQAILARAKARELKPIEGVEGVEGAFCRRLSVAETESLGEVKSLPGIHFLVRALCNAKGEPLFTDEDITALAEMDQELLAALYRPAAEHNGLGKKAGEELEKN